jgi:hypothetical protein
MYPRRTSIVKKARIKKARIRYKLFLEVKETLLDKDLQNREEGKTQKGRTKTKNSKTNSMNKSDSISLVQQPSSVKCMIAKHLSQLGFSIQ